MRHILFRLLYITAKELHRQWVLNIIELHTKLLVTKKLYLSIKEVRLIATISATSIVYLKETISS